MIKQIQYHPVSDEIMHVDLMRVRRSEKMTISVPIVLIGEAIGVKEGGILSQSMTQIEISCYPTDVPEKIELNIEDLELNSSMSVGDLNVELEDVDILSESNLNIVSVTPPAIEEEVEEIEEEEGVDQEDESQDTSDEKTDAPSPDGADDNTGN
jgi:large subunit ribosomal protein L25